MARAVFNVTIRQAVQSQLFQVWLTLLNGRGSLAQCGLSRWNFWRRQNEKAIGSSSGGTVRSDDWDSVLAMGQPQEMKQEEQKPKLMNIKGTVKADSDKITFVADSDGKSWNVVSPETLKDHVGTTSN
jgi:hypothetical protein